jgi:GNAT superfamily N-acetyltransferase
MKDKSEIRPARRGDEGTMLMLLRELAEYEKLVPIFSMSEASIARDFFGPSPACSCELALEDGEPVGVATWYWTFSSFRSVRGIYLEDLYVRDSVRGRGYGKALLAHLARTAQANGGAYVKWAVLDWNKPSIEFYERLGAKPVAGWMDYQVDGKPFVKLAGG